MREFDREGLEIATFQGRLFEASTMECDASSPIFLRRFFRSHYAYKMDTRPVVLQALVLPRAFEEIEKEYGYSNYGKKKYNKEALYWLGYFTRYICYTREITSALLYRLFDVNKIYSLYEAYHTQSEEWCIAHLLESSGYTEATLNIHERLKACIRGSYLEKLGVRDRTTNSSKS